MPSHINKPYDGFMILLSFKISFLKDFISWKVDSPLALWLSDWLAGWLLFLVNERQSVYIRCMVANIHTRKRIAEVSDQIKARGARIHTLAELLRSI